MGFSDPLVSWLLVGGQLLEYITSSGTENETVLPGSRYKPLTFFLFDSLALICKETTHEKQAAPENQTNA